MSEQQKYNGLKRMVVNNELVPQKDFIVAVMAKVSLPEELVKLAMKRAQGLDVPDPEDADAKTMKTVAQVEKLAKKSFEEATVMMANKREAAENEEKEREERKNEFIEAYQEAEPSEAIAIPVASFVDEKVAEALGESFSVDSKTGKIELKKGADAIKAFGAGFRSLNELFDKSSELGEGFAIYEARLALAAKEAFGSEWPNALAGADKRDILRIRKNMRAIEIFTDLGFSLNNIPIGTLRVLTEASYDKEDADNNTEVKKKVIKDFLDKSKKKGTPLNQIEARELVAQATPEKQSTARKHWNYFYFTSNGKTASVVGSFDLDDELFAAATMVIDSKSRIVTIDEEGSYHYEQIPAYAGKPAEEAVAKQAEAPKGKGSGKKKAKVEEEEVLEEQPQETAEETEEESDPLDALFNDE
jgi:hypothetical protein